MWGDGLPRSLRSLAMTGPEGLQAAKAACHSEEAGPADVGIRSPFAPCFGIITVI